MERPAHIKKILIWFCPYQFRKGYLEKITVFYYYGDNYKRTCKAQSAVTGEIAPYEVSCRRGNGMMKEIYIRTGQKDGLCLREVKVIEGTNYQYYIKVAVSKRKKKTDQT